MIRSHLFAGAYGFAINNSRPRLISFWGVLLRAAIYAPVSTTDQNCELQLADLGEYVRRREWEIAGRRESEPAGIRSPDERR